MSDRKDKTNHKVGKKEKIKCAEEENEEKEEK